MKTVIAVFVGVVIGFASAMSLQSAIDAGARSKSKRTAGDCLSISRALEEFRNTNGAYPPLDGNVSHLAPYLVPKYIAQLPTRDSAGQPLFVVLNGSRAAVIATGRYGVVVEGGKLLRAPFAETSATPN